MLLDVIAIAIIAMCLVFSTAAAIGQ